MRDNTPPGMAVAAGEYTYDLDDARVLLEAEAVDVLQADVTRCGGVSGFLEVGALCEAHHIDLSGHCAPSITRHVACAAPRVRHLEWFHDHVRIEQMLFDGAPNAKAERSARTSTAGSWARVQGARTPSASGWEQGHETARSR